MGVGGVGINAVQGAAHAGALHVIAVDPVPFKREMAEKLGATHSFADIDEAAEVARGLTNGQGADSAIVTVGVTKASHVGQAFAAIRKGGVCVVTGIGNFRRDGAANITGSTSRCPRSGCRVRSTDSARRPRTFPASCSST